jgi:hypothetical protein
MILLHNSEVLHCDYSTSSPITFIKHIFMTNSSNTIDDSGICDLHYNIDLLNHTFLPQTEFQENLQLTSRCEMCYLLLPKRFIWYSVSFLVVKDSKCNCLSLTWRGYSKMFLITGSLNMPM